MLCCALPSLCCLVPMRVPLFGSTLLYCYLDNEFCLTELFAFYFSVSILYHVLQIMFISLSYDYLFLFISSIYFCIITCVSEKPGEIHLDIYRGETQLGSIYMT